MTNLKNYTDIVDIPYLLHLGFVETISCNTKYTFEHGVLEYVIDKIPLTNNLNYTVERHSFYVYDFKLEKIPTRQEIAEFIYNHDHQKAR